MSPHWVGPSRFHYPTPAMRRLNKAWDEPIAEGWTVVSMKDDWKTSYPPTGKEQAAAP
jgi:hypothetical protein